MVIYFKLYSGKRISYKNIILPFFLLIIIIKNCYNKSIVTVLCQKNVLIIEVGSNEFLKPVLRLHYCFDYHTK